MADLKSIADHLNKRIEEKGVSRKDLRESAGLSIQTTINVLSGTHDYRVTTLLAMLDRLDLDLVLLPKDAAAALAPSHSVKTRIQRLLEEEK